MPLPLALTMGDPAGCGPSISGAAWQALRAETAAAFYLIGAPELVRGAPVQVIASPAEALDVFPSALPVLALPGVPAIAPGAPDAAAAPAIIRAIELAVADALAGRASGVVTNPINKALLYASGFKFPGHTEFVAHLCEAAGRAASPVMMLTGGGLRVALATIHMPYAAVPAALGDGRLERIARVVHRALVEDFGIALARIAFSGLNPHAGEEGTIGREEIDLINPAADRLQAEGLTVSHARPGDTVFAEALSGAWDAVIAMTHDQGLIPVKTLDFWGGVNSTLGLPIVRTSPDHGTAYEAAAAGTCRADSLIAAIRLAAGFAANRMKIHA
ncbi:MAG: 4-hydroxythreonine-4-phosphate dehydrogenase PdxA [Hyphomonas sp.]|uniref:4-hydroxythreonine-4-phosphate dehydrogenase PdxA n=1 Tax=Hyphomonas sp. TaxID=87 RepID=UPI001836FCA6|nr:4-hydroxythreonine-4-phosphate dehydrogenase PdxA [Hyphomonas sp.]MBU3920652.1 4-hydroxythreonine-4-phosphate dehydrogenase PdxA [Alphaproteobacteria bacterium]MBA3070025.1 4-hydroxythreonine-4-phosphate dehydrogenase PdxA [Hyphomonas sp.]MBU4060399.1 4-hydroxythreonine-4-phosphate dehydrogenase PdxA [Alphaproteobacteria bacterium]MBU4163067.1 4-hydroxythreonine-4-phosphate dehydrogenase PdxA [Alphaproteobacteria bacterium]MBU4568646.1 4-hydroxythreonine-4-phosphate dehydrogenase PdxA [Alph